MVAYLGQLKDAERRGVKQVADTANVRVENQLDFGGPWPDPPRKRKGDRSGRNRKGRDQGHHHNGREIIVTNTTPAHQWTHDGDKVLLVKCVDANGTSHEGFQWPSSGPVESPNWSEEPNCESGGLFGWPWGIGLGSGKLPDYYAGKWIVFAAPPDTVVSLGDKAKVPRAEVVYYGNWWGALLRVDAGRVAWCEHAANGAALAIGARGAASATGESGAASAIGESGAASAIGASGAASATGESGAASATGRSGAASATGARGAASATGESGAASATGWSGAASATGWSGAASATGARGAASATGENSTLEAGPGGICVTTAEYAIWRVHADAVFVQRWKGEGEWHTAFIVAGEHNLQTGDVVEICRGEVKTPER